MGIHVRLVRALPFAIVLSLCALLTALPIYRLRMDMLHMEGNDLCSGQAAIVDDDVDEAIRLLPSLGDDARLQMIFKENPELRIMVANDYSAVPLPQHGSRETLASCTLEAIVGADVTTEEIEAVVPEMRIAEARLGVSDESVLSRTILISDVEALRASANAGTLVVDGAQAAQRYAELRPSAQLRAFSRGLARRSDVDVLSPIILTLAFVLVAVGGVVAGVLHGLAMLPVVRVRRLIGLSIVKYVAPRVTALAVLAIALLFAGHALTLSCGMVGRQPFVGFDVLSILLVTLPVISAALVLTLGQKRDWGRLQQ